MAKFSVENMNFLSSLQPLRELLGNVDEASSGMALTVNFNQYRKSVDA